jgi:signal transduction histidine kinase
VTERTAELQRSNRELDQFAYIISHDLKAPLRAIYFLAEWIEEDAKDALPPTSQEHFAKLRGRVRRMDKLLDDMLAYSRAGRQRHTPESVDTKALVQDIVELLAPPPGFRVVMEEPLPVIETERVPLETVLRNLISNAIKHHHDPAQGFVYVSARSDKGESGSSGTGAADLAADSEAGERIEFTVADNGPGIEPAYHQRIFEIFSTLRSRDEVEGSGMGLTVVQKIVETRGGRIWVESALGEGATFRFTWPL